MEESRGAPLHAGECVRAPRGESVRWSPRGPRRRAPPKAASGSARNAAGMSQLAATPSDPLPWRHSGGCQKQAEGPRASRGESRRNAPLRLCLLRESLAAAPEFSMAELVQKGPNRLQTKGRKAFLLHSHGRRKCRVLFQLVWKNRRWVPTPNPLLPFPYPNPNPVLEVPQGSRLSEA